MKAKNCWMHNNWPEWNISNIWYEFAHRVEKENDRGWRYLRSEGWRKHRCSCFESSWFEEDTVTDRHQTGPRSLLFRRFSSSRGIHSRWLPKNTSRETNTATAILRRRTNSWTDHAQKQRVCKFYESWTASSTVLFKNKKENGEEDVPTSFTQCLRPFVKKSWSNRSIYCFLFLQLLKMYKWFWKLILNRFRILFNYFYNDFVIGEFIIISFFNRREIYRRGERTLVFLHQNEYVRSAITLTSQI